MKTVAALMLVSFMAQAQDTDKPLMIKVKSAIVSVESGSVVEVPSGYYITDTGYANLDQAVQELQAEVAAKPEGVPVWVVATLCVVAAGAGAFVGYRLTR